MGLSRTKRASHATTSEAQANHRTPSLRRRTSLLLFQHSKRKNLLAHPARLYLLQTRGSGLALAIIILCCAIAMCCVLHSILVQSSNTYDCACFLINKKLSVIIKFLEATGIWFSMVEGCIASIVYTSYIKNSQIRFIDDRQYFPDSKDSIAWNRKYNS